MAFCGGHGHVLWAMISGHLGYIALSWRLYKYLDICLSIGHGPGPDH